MAVTRATPWAFPDRGDGRVDMTGFLPIASPVNDAVTPEHISLYAEVMGSVSQSATATVQYKLVADSTFSDALPLWRIQPQWVDGAAPAPVVDAFAGCLFDLTPGNTYDVRVTFTDGVDVDVRQEQFGTRPLPTYSPVAPIQVADQAALQAALNAATQGQIIEITGNIALTSTVTMTGRNGTEANPIVIRGTSRDGINISRSTSAVLQFRGCSHVILETLTLTGSNVDSGTDASSVGVSLNENVGTPCSNVTIRNCRIQGVDRAVNIDSGQIANGTLIYDNIITGNNSDIGWNATGTSSQTWNDDGIDLQGSGNCAFNNDMDWFGDAFAFNEDPLTTFQTGCFAYRNKVTYCGDDFVEFDESTRNCAVYDNYVRNASTGISFDKVFGGPIYAFRNRIINLRRSALKCNADTSGVLIYNNTFVITEGDGIENETRGWYFALSQGQLKQWEYRNNLFLWEGTSDVMRFDPGTVNWTPRVCDYNGWGMNNAEIRYANLYGPGVGTSVSAVQSVFDGLVGFEHIHDNDHQLTDQAATFQTPATLGSDYLTAVTAEPSLELSTTSEARNKGVLIPGITNHSDGGAIGFGETPPTVGNRFAG